MSEFTPQIRITIELFFMVGTLWWAARIIASVVAYRESTVRDIDKSSIKLDHTKLEVKKLNNAISKIRDQVIPSQVNNIQRMEKELASGKEQIEKSQLETRVQLLREVKNYWAQDPSSRYFRASGWKPLDDVP